MTLPEDNVMPEYTEIRKVLSNIRELCKRKLPSPAVIQCEILNELLEKREVLQAYESTNPPIAWFSKLTPQTKRKLYEQLQEESETDFGELERK